MGLLSDAPILANFDSKTYDKVLESQELKEKKRIEWLMQKKGVFSASESHRLVAYPERNELSKGAITYVTEKVEESLTIGVDEGYKNKAMDDGSLGEPESMEYFMEVTGLKVTKYGDEQEFVKLGKDFGATPDGIIEPDGGVEGKCPQSKAHLFYLRFIKNEEDLKRHKPEYYWQCQTGMLATGKNYWYWFSYNKNFRNPLHRMVIIKVERNEQDIELFKSRHRMAVALKNSIIKELNG